MSTRIRDLTVFHRWLHDQPERYVVLRQKHSGERCVELNLLADAALADRLDGAFRKAREGVKIDVYGHGRADYLGWPHLPDDLSARCLAARVPYTNAELSWWRPAPDEELDALNYHLAYHKPDASGLGTDSWHASLQCAQPCHYSDRLRELHESTGRARAESLPALHQQLCDAGLAIDPARLQAYVKSQFARGIKSYFHAWLMDQPAGELNLFVVRAIAIHHGLTQAFLDRLQSQYNVLMTKRVDWQTRLLRMRHMRGGKWKRGGRPHLAVVVYDPAPMPVSDTDREAHPFVFNARQFVKQEWRSWFTQQSGARPQDNPIHSTDNEAEAVGHLPLFFDAAEQDSILSRVAALREGRERDLGDVS